MCKNSSAKCYQENTERLQKKLKDIKVFLKMKKKKSNNMIMSDIKIFQKMKKISWLGIEKHIIK